MQRIYQTAALCFVALSAFVVWESWDLEYYTNLGPGSGFFPLWLGVVMGALACLACPCVPTKGKDLQVRTFSGDKKVF